MTLKPADAALEQHITSDLQNGKAIKAEKNTIPLISQVHRGAVHDGPGLRTVVYFKGCPLRCQWCFNAESLRAGAELRFCKTFCLGMDICGKCITVCNENALQSISPSFGSLSVIRQRCTMCEKCTDICPTQALSIIGQSYTASEILNIVVKDRLFYDQSGGGMTLSGGEPLAWPGLASELLGLARSEGIHTAIATCGWFDMDARDTRIALDHTDLILFDIKHIDSIVHRRYTQVDNSRILENLRCLGIEYPHLPIIVRTAIVPGFNDSEQTVLDIARTIACIPTVQGYELHPFTPLGEQKYLQLGHPAPVSFGPPPDEARMEHFRKIVRGWRS